MRSGPSIKCASISSLNDRSIRYRIRERDANLYNVSATSYECFNDLWAILWLRIASRFPIFFINEQLIVKRGGHADQLSTRSWGNDRYRVVAIQKQLSQDHLAPDERRAALEMLDKKCRILAGGFFKRGRIEEGMKYQSIRED